MTQPNDQDTERRSYPPTAVTLPRPTHGNDQERARPAPASRPLRYLVLLGRGPLGEIWKAETGEGVMRAVHSLSAGPGADRGEALERLLSLAHPALPPWDCFWDEWGRPLLVAEHFEHTLRTRARECWDRNQAGVPPAELVECLGGAAEALDDLYIRHQVQHLALTPECVALHDGRALLTGFGLAQLLWLPAGLPGGMCNPRYGAPELKRGRYSYRCDQYSLAVIYAEARTGAHPFRGRERQADLTMLAAAEREVVAKALNDRSCDRFPTCTDFMEALGRATTRPALLADSPALLPPVIAAPGQESMAYAFPGAGVAPEYFLHQLEERLVGRAEVRWRHRVRYRLEPGVSLEHRAAVALSPGDVVRALERFARRWRGRFVAVGEQEILLALPAAPGLWRRLLGGRAGMQVCVRPITAPRPGVPGEVLVLLRPARCEGADAVRLLDDLGPEVLDSLREHLGALPDNRAQDRVLCAQPLQVTPVLADFSLAEAVAAVSKDVSPGGIGFLLREPLPTGDLYVNLPWLPGLGDVSVRARVVRNLPRADGWHEVGAAFGPTPARRTGR